MHGTDITTLLKHWRGGDREARDALLEVVYDELRRVAARALSRGHVKHSLQPTALTHEAYLRMAKEGMPASDRSHFFALSAQIVRRVLVDHSRKRASEKRGGSLMRIRLSDDMGATTRSTALEELDDAITALARVDVAAARVVEYRYFGGLTVHEIADEMEISISTITRKWNFARSWLFSEISGSGE